MKPRYKSSIPADAKERVVERFADGTKKKSEYRLDRELIGVRTYFDTGESEFEYALRDGKQHGVQYA